MGLFLQTTGHSEALPEEFISNERERVEQRMLCIIKTIYEAIQSCYGSDNTPCSEETLERITTRVLTEHGQINFGAENHDFLEIVAKIRRSALNLISQKNLTNV